MLNSDALAPNGHTNDVDTQTPKTPVWYSELGSNAYPPYLDHAGHHYAKKNMRCALALFHTFRAPAAQSRCLSTRFWRKVKGVSKTLRCPVAYASSILAEVERSGSIEPINEAVPLGRTEDLSIRRIARSRCRCYRRALGSRASEGCTCRI